MFLQIVLDYQYIARLCPWILIVTCGQEKTVFKYICPKENQASEKKKSSQSSSVVLREHKV